MKESRWKSFLGGNDLIFTLAAGILIGILLLVLRQLDFIFEPVFVILSNIVMPVVISFLLYYLFNPIVDFMENRKIKRIWGVVIVYVLVVILLIGIVAVLYPQLQEQFMSFVESFPEFIEDIVDSVLAFVDNFSPNQTVENLIAEAEQVASNIFDNFFDYFTQGISGLTSLISSITSTVLTIVTVPIILFFLLKDDQKFFSGALKGTPPKWRPDLIKMGVKINNQVGAYIKGQLTVAIVNGVLMFIGFYLIGLNYSGILGLAGGILSIIPYLGPTLTFVPALIIALMDSWTRVLLLIIVWLVVQFIEGNLIEPNVMGRQLQVHPLTIIIVLFIMGDLLGIFGLIFGIPIYAILKVIVVHFFQKFKARYNAIYGDIAGEYHLETTNKNLDFGDDNIDKVKNEYISSIDEEEKEAGTTEDNKEDQ